VAGLAGSDPDPDRQVGLAGAGRTQEDDVLSGGDEIESAEVEKCVSFQRPLVVEVELFDRLSGGEPGRFDPEFPAVGLTGRDFPFQAGSQELFVGSCLGSGPLGEPFHRLFHRGGLESSAQIGDVG
jgi:hypothetical protein